MTIQKKPKTLVLTCLAAASALAYVFLVFLPGQRAIQKVRRELQTKQEAIIDADRLVLAIQQTKDLLENVHIFKTKWQATTPTVDRVATAYAAVSNYAKQSGASVVRFEPQTPVRMAALSQVPVNMVVEGEFQQIFDLLRRLDESPHPLWEKELSLQPMKENAKLLRCQVSLMIFADNRDKSN